MDKEKALKLIFQSAELYSQNFCNQMLLIISENKSLNKTFSVEIQFDKTNFLHLTGVKFLPRSSISPSVFFDRCISKRLSVNDFEMSADGTTEQKLAILPQMLNSVNLSTNMIGDFQGRRPALITDKLVGNGASELYMIQNGIILPQTLSLTWICGKKSKTSSGLLLSIKRARVNRIMKPLCTKLKKSVGKELAFLILILTYQYPRTNP